MTASETCVGQRVPEVSGDCLLAVHPVELRCGGDKASISICAGYDAVDVRSRGGEVL